MQQAGEDSSSFDSDASFADLDMKRRLYEFELNDSQLNAIIDCLSASHQSQKNSIKLVWGPPGTGKTKTICTLLWAFLIKRSKTLSCAPTNTAIIEVSSRLLRLVRELSSDMKYSLGDLVLLGNKSRMKIDGDLSEIFLDDRVDRLMRCFAPLTGWSYRLRSMMSLLENAVFQHELYLEEIEKKIKELEEEEEPPRKLTLKEFILKRFYTLAEELNFCLRTLSMDLPKISTSAENFKYMDQLLELINMIAVLFKSKGVTDEMLKEIFQTTIEEGCYEHIYMELHHIKNASTEIKLRIIRALCVQIQRVLLRNLDLPIIFNRRLIQDFCLQGAIIIFCTCSSAYRLHNVDMEKPVEFLIVDEAAQLKECECLIPMQLSRIRHAVFIGDEHQLPALVKSQVCI